MMIAINNTGNKGFSPRWVDYCKDHGIPYKLVNAYDSNIVEQLADCDVFMFQHHQDNYKDALFAKQLLYSLQLAGKKVFPDFNTTWHFDDKVGQKYLFESIDSPFVKSYIFYTKNEALQWANSTNFPKVFKLRGGASSANVKLAKNQKDAIKFINKSFGKGFSQYDWKEKFIEARRKQKMGKVGWRAVLRPIYYTLKKYPTPFSHYKGNEKGYAYFQDFIPNNTYDIRIIVIGDKAFGIKRVNRENDFRASGSGKILYDKNELDERCVKVAFEQNKKIKSQSIAFDFVFDNKNKPLIVEISYAFMASGYDQCTGYWDNDLKWYEEPFNPYGWMVDTVLGEE
jgi:glutathione synthase/RimK-type ligase-like ATP-grasp enzyme